LACFNINADDEESEPVRHIYTVAIIDSDIHDATEPSGRIVRHPSNVGRLFQNPLTPFARFRQAHSGWFSLCEELSGMGGGYEYAEQQARTFHCDHYL
jgi:hypothetical protein